MKHPSNRYQTGVTLASLLIATAIGIFLVGAVIKIYLDSKTSFNMRNVVSEVAENQRFAIDDMRRILVMAGRDVLALEDELPARRPFPPVATGGIVDGGGSGSDTIAIRYRTGPSCGAYQNVSLAEPPTMVRFYITDNSGDGTADDLVCEMTTYPGGTPATVTRTLATGIHGLKVLYGVDDDGDGFANRYLSASSVEDYIIVPTPAGFTRPPWTPWSKVVSLRIALLAGSTTKLPAQYRSSTPPTRELLGMTIHAPDGDHLYRVASTTLALRNLRPTIIQRQ